MQCHHDDCSEKLNENWNVLGSQVRLLVFSFSFASSKGTFGEISFQSGFNEGNTVTNTDLGNSYLGIWMNARD